MPSVPFGRMSVLVIAGFCCLAACSTVPITGRKQLDFVDPSTAAALGAKTFAEVQQKYPVSHDPAANAMVQRVGKRLAGASGLQENWEFVVLQSPEVNAFALPGGKVAVFTGLLPLAQDDAGLATVLGHEIGHVMAHHASERISRSELVEAGTGVLTAALGGNDPGTQQMVAGLLGAGATFGIELPFSRQQESEADHIGLDLMARAGYDPREAIPFWERMQAQAGGNQPPAFFSDHPTDAQRIADLKKLLPEALKNYRPVASAAGASRQ